MREKINENQKDPRFAPRPGQALKKECISSLMRIRSIQSVREKGFELVNFRSESWSCTSSPKEREVRNKYLFCSNSVQQASTTRFSTKVLSLCCTVSLKIRIAWNQTWGSWVWKQICYQDRYATPIENTLFDMTSLDLLRLPMPSRY